MVPPTSSLKIRLPLSSLAGKGNGTVKGKEKASLGGSDARSAGQSGYSTPKADPTTTTETSWARPEEAADFQRDRTTWLGSPSNSLRRVRSVCAKGSESVGPPFTHPLPPTPDAGSLGRQTRAIQSPIADGRKLSSSSTMFNKLEADLVVHSKEDLNALTHVRRLLRGDSYADQRDLLKDFLDGNNPPIPKLGFMPSARQGV
jgi:hypothetical protein